MTRQRLSTLQRQSSLPIIAEASPALERGVSLPASKKTTNQNGSFKLHECKSDALLQTLESYSVVIVEQVVALL